MLNTLEIFSSRAAYPLGFEGGGGVILGLTAAIETDLIQITNIEGLGPVTADINTAKLGNIDGDVYLGATTSKRNIVLTLRINPDSDNTIEVIRNIIYAHFMPKSKIRMKFDSSHLPVVDITGYVETITPNIFSKDPEYQVSVICPTSAFADLNETTAVTVADYDGDYTLYYDGTVDCGVRIDIYKDAYAGPSPTDDEVMLLHSHPQTEIMVLKHLTFSDTETLRINSIPGDKTVKIIRPGLPSTNILQKVTTASIWPILTPGDNVFDFTGFGNLRVDITYRRLYGGL